MWWCEEVIKKRKSPKDHPVYYPTIEDTYNIIRKANIATGHCGHDRMLKHLGQKYANITTDAVELFYSYCVVCQEKRKCPKTTGVVVKPILSSEFNSRGQIDLVEMHYPHKASSSRSCFTSITSQNLLSWGPSLPRELLKLPFNCWIYFSSSVHQPSFRVTTAQNSHSKSPQSSKSCCRSSSWFMASPDIPKARVLLKDQTVTSKIFWWLGWVTTIHRTGQWESNLFSNKRTALIMLASTEPPIKPCLERTLKLDWDLVVFHLKFLKDYNLKMTFWHSVPPPNPHLFTTMSHLQTPMKLHLHLLFLPPRLPQCKIMTILLYWILNSFTSSFKTSPINEKKHVDPSYHRQKNGQVILYWLKGRWSWR